MWCVRGSSVVFVGDLECGGVISGVNRSNVVMCVRC